MNENYKSIASQIIIQAIVDLKNIKPKKKGYKEKRRIKNREDAKRFMYSKWCEELCEFLEIDSAVIIKNYKKYIDFDDIIVENMECVNER